MEGGEWDVGINGNLTFIECLTCGWLCNLHLLEYSLNIHNTEIPHPF